MGQSILQMTRPENELRFRAAQRIGLTSFSEASYTLMEFRRNLLSSQLKHRHD